MTARPRLLVLRALGLGDLLTVVPALRGLARAFPGCRMVLAAPRWLEPLALKCGGPDQLLPTTSLDDRICYEAPEMAVNLHGRGPESDRALLATNPGRLVAFEHPRIPETSGGPVWNADEHEVERWCRLLRVSGIRADPADLLLDPDQIGRGALPEGTTLLHPGAAFAARRWPADRWAAVAQAELARDKPVAVTAGPLEQNLLTKIGQYCGSAAGSVIWLRPPTVLDLAQAVAAATRVVSGDTGVAHLATALRTPSIVLFGPTPPALWGPPPAPRHVVLWKGRLGDPLAGLPDPGLLAITTAEVIGALQRLERIVETPAG